MSGFDYGNARIRAMKSRLLPRERLEALAAAESVQSLIDALTETVYRSAVEVALARADGVPAILTALRQDAQDTVGKVRSFFEGRARTLVELVLRPYDIQNLKAVLRGLSRGASPDEIGRAAMPLGNMSAGVLADLARSTDVREAIDKLATLRVPAAQALLEARARRPGADLADLELALDRWHFRDARRQMRRPPPEARALLEALDLDADLVNLQVGLRFAHAPELRDALIQRAGPEALRRLFVDPGNLSLSLLSRAAERNNPEGFVEVFRATSCEAPLLGGLESYARTGRLSDFERHLYRFRLRWMSRAILRDPLGIGVLVGYVALKINELRNLRWIAHGVNLSSPADDILENVESV